MDQICPKRYFQSKTQKVKIITEFCLLKLVLREISAQTDNFDFLNQFCQERYFQSKTKKNEHHHGILHIWISLGTEVQLKLIILSFWNKFTWKRYFQSKTEQSAQGLQGYDFYVVNINSAVAFKHFEDLKVLIILNIFKRKIGYFLPPGLFLS